jgi:hypothetical protein
MISVLAPADQGTAKRAYGFSFWRCLPGVAAVIQAQSVAANGRPRTLHVREQLVRSLRTRKVAVDRPVIDYIENAPKPN